MEGTHVFDAQPEWDDVIAAATVPALLYNRESDLESIAFLTEDTEGINNQR